LNVTSESRIADCGKGSEPTHAEIAFSVDDVEAMRQELIGKGIDMHDEVLTWRHYQYCKGKGPQGNIFQIINDS